MRKLGLIQKQQYNIPLIDTIGRKHYQELKNNLKLFSNPM
jgi:hypothetical protein